METATLTGAPHAWRRLEDWLRTSDADSFVDDAVMGCALEHDAREILEDHGIPWTVANRRVLARMVDRALTAGEV